MLNFCEKWHKPLQKTKAKDPLWAKEIRKKGNSQEVERTKPMAIMIIKIILQKGRDLSIGSIIMMVICIIRDRSKNDTM